MRVTMLTLGSHGDVRPYVALGAGLRASGDTVTIATHRPFAGLVEQYGLHYHPLAGDPVALLRSREGTEMWRRRSSLGFALELIRTARDLLDEIYRDCTAAAAGADVIVASATAFFAGYSLAEARRIPFFLAPNFPASATREQPGWLMPEMPPWLGAARGTYNLLTHQVALQAVWQLMRGGVNRWRTRDLDLPPLPPRGPYRSMHRRHFPILYGYSPAVVPKPPDWPEWYRVTGYWFLDSLPEWRPDPALVDFIESGPRPVYVGFGSPVDERPEELTEIVKTALRWTGTRAVISRGWGSISTGAGGEDHFVVDSVPHDWLFPRVAAVVHHAGAGTAAAGLRAGVPAVTIPFSADQPFWARRLSEIGGGTLPIPRRRLTAGALAHALEAAICDTDLRRRSAELGERIRAESGVAVARDALHTGMERWRGW